MKGFFTGINTIGLELTNWLNERQIADAENLEVIERPIRRALASRRRHTARSLHLHTE
jgi:hypothetical protein